MIKVAKAEELLGQPVRAKVLRWEGSRDGELSAPMHEKTDQGFVTGTLAADDVPAWGGYRRYAVGDYDIDPQTVEASEKKPVKHGRRIVAKFPTGKALIDHMQQDHGYVTSMTPKPNSARYKEWKSAHETEYHGRWADRQTHDHSHDPIKTQPKPISSPKPSAPTAPGLKPGVESMTIDGPGWGEKRTLYVKPEHKDRIQALAPHAQYGEHYNRGVAEGLGDYSLFTQRGEHDSAERYLSGAEEWLRRSQHHLALLAHQRLSASFLELPADKMSDDQLYTHVSKHDGKFHPSSMDRNYLLRQHTRLHDSEGGNHKANHRLAYGEVKAPPQVDTLQDATCPVCGDQNFDGEKCQVCGYIKPPDMFMDPDLDRASQEDLRGEDVDQEEEDPMAVGDQMAQQQTGDLICDNCGTTFSSTPQPESPDTVVTSIPTLPKPGPQDQQGPAINNPTPAPADGVAEGDAQVPQTQQLQVGGLCPVCGKGTLEANTGAGQGNTDTGEGVFVPPEDSEEDEGPDNISRLPESRAALRGEGADVPMARPALAALAEQQRMIERLEKVCKNQADHIAVLEAQMGSVAKLAGIEPQLRSVGRKVVAFRRRADQNDPAQPVPEPPAEAPEETEAEAITPAGQDDVQTIGESPVADVAPDAVTDVQDPFGETAFEPLDLNNQDVTQPVAGTQEQRPLEETKTLTDVRVGNPDNPQPAFPLTPAFADQPNTGAGQATAAQIAAQRIYASLHLARLRITAGIADPSMGDLQLGQAIASSTMSDETMAHEASVLQATLLARPQAQRPQPQRRAPANLVPRTAGAHLRPDNMAVESSDGMIAPVAPANVSFAVTPEEVLFE